jgi:hypothetical protein
MKQFATKKCQCIIKSLLLLFCLLILKSELFSQPPPATEWTSVTWMRGDIYNIEEQNVNSKQNIFKFNTEKLSSGVYLISVKGENILPTYVKVINIK